MPSTSSPQRKGVNIRKKLQIASVWVSLTFLSAGCSGPPTTATETVPVIQGILLAGRSTQSIWVEWSASGSASNTPRATPVDPALVSLELVSGNSTTPYRPEVTTPGLFTVDVLVVPEEAYTLRGTIAGMPVRAEVVVPKQTKIVLPEGDTAIVGIGHPLHLTWRNTGAIGYAIGTTAADLQPDRAVGAHGISFTADTVTAEFAPRNNEHFVVFVMAMDSVSFDVLRPDTPGFSGNVTGGAVGVFGAATLDTVIAIWVPEP